MIHLLGAVLLAAGLSNQAPTPSQRSGPPAASKECDGFECAAREIDKGDFTAAIARLQKALASDPRDVRLRNLLGIALTGAAKIEEGSRQFREALAQDPEFVPARKNLAVNEFNQGRLDSAERLFQEVLKRLPADEVAHVHLGEIHHVRKQPALALPHYEKGASRLTTRPAWILHYAFCLLAQGQTAKATDILDALPGEDGSSQFEAGILLGRANAHAAAARHFAAARATYKDPYAAGYNQILMLVEAGDHEAAIRAAEDMLHTNRQSGELFNLASRAYVGAKRIQDAYDALRAAARLEPAEEQHYTDLALICLDHENYDLAVEIIDIGLRHQPSSSRLHLYRGVLFVMKGLVERAQDDFQKAVTLAPTSGVAPVALAMVWMQSGRAAEAVGFLRKRLAAGSRQAIIPYMFGIALLRSGVDPADAAAQEAIRAFEDAMRLDARFAGPRTELGKIYLRRGDVEKAIEHLEQAVALDPDNPAPAYSLAQAHRRMGNTTRARELLARVSRLNAEGRGDDPERELKRSVLRIVREGVSAPGTSK